MVKKNIGFFKFLFMENFLFEKFVLCLCGKLLIFEKFG